MIQLCTLVNNTIFREDYFFILDTKNSMTWSTRGIGEQGPSFNGTGIYGHSGKQYFYPFVVLLNELNISASFFSSALTIIFLLFSCPC